MRKERLAHILVLSLRSPRQLGRVQLNCKRAIRQLSEYLDGELDAGLTRELGQHLAQCRDCRLVVDTTRKTIEIYCNSEPLPLPEPVRERLMRALAAKLRVQT